MQSGQGTGWDFNPHSNTMILFLVSPCCPLHRRTLWSREAQGPPSHTRTQPLTADGLRVRGQGAPALDLSPILLEATCCYSGCIKTGGRKSPGPGTLRDTSPAQSPPGVAGIRRKKCPQRLTVTTTETLVKAVEGKLGNSPVRHRRLRT